MAQWQYSDTWLLDSYLGTGGYRDGSYLIPHPRETITELNRRRELSTFPNYTKKIVDSILGYLFYVPPGRDTGNNSFYSDFVFNADGKGTNLGFFIQKATKLAMILGTVYLLVDKDEDSNLPYIVIKFPSSVSNTKRDRKGNLTSITFTELQEDSTIYRSFDNQSWKLSTDILGKDIISTGDHNLNRLPVIPLHSSIPISDEIAVPAWIQDIALCNLDLYNSLSELRTQYRSQVFSILLLPQRFNDSGQSSEVTVGTNNALAYNPDNGAPSYLQAPESAVTLLEANVDKLIDRIYALANLEFVSSANSSGVALKYWFRASESMFSGLVSLIEDAEVKLAELVCDWTDTTWDGTIKYNRKFDLQDIASELTTSLNALTVEISPTASKEIKRKIAHDVLGDVIDSDVMAIIDDEINTEVMSPELTPTQELNTQEEQFTPIPVPMGLTNTEV